MSDAAAAEATPGPGAALTDGGTAETPPPASPATGGSAPADGGVVIPENWKEALPEDMRANPTIQNVSGVEDLAKMLISSQSLIGADADRRLLKPLDDDSEGWAELFGKLGKPETAEAYEISTPEGAEVDQEFLTSMRRLFHGANMTQAQAAAVAEGYQAYAIKREQDKADEASRKADEEIAALKKEWGNAYDQKHELARRACKAFDPTGAVVDSLEANNHLGRAGIYKMLAAIGEKMAPDGAVPAGEGEATFALTPADAAAKIERLKGDENFMARYSDKNHPRHQEAVDEMFQLNLAVAAAPGA